ncbi:hypothetical protein [Brevibacillus porteri]|uniref:hypothetical protein n=1 Tax=Brevibacillus porteri TaxID=2126350 RepID=UPI003629D2C4
MTKKEVYGFFINDGDGNELLYHLGIYAEHEKAYEKLEEMGNSSIWIDTIDYFE